MKLFNKQMVLVLASALVVGAFSVGCKEKTTEENYNTMTNSVDTMKEATTNAAHKTWDATKEGARKVGDAVTNAATEVKEGITNAWENMTSTNQ